MGRCQFSPCCLQLSPRLIHLCRVSLQNTRDRTIANAAYNVATAYPRRGTAGKQETYSLYNTANAGRFILQYGGVANATVRLSWDATAEQDNKLRKVRVRARVRARA